MCQMWLRIRTGVLWDPARKLACAVEAMDLNKVKSIFISMDPFHKDNYALREFWYQISTPNVKKTNPKLAIKTEIRTDGKTPYFVADLEDNRKLVFKTEGMQTTDVIMRLNKLLGNKEIVLPKQSES